MDTRKNTGYLNGISFVDPKINEVLGVEVLE
jgi:hypothetical protein